MMSYVKEDLSVQDVGQKGWGEGELKLSLVSLFHAKTPGISTNLEFTMEQLAQAINYPKSDFKNRNVQKDLLEILMSQIGEEAQEEFEKAMPNGPFKLAIKEEYQQYEKMMHSYDEAFGVAGLNDPSNSPGGVFFVDPSAQQRRVFSAPFHETDVVFSSDNNFGSLSEDFAEFQKRLVYVLDRDFRTVDGNFVEETVPVLRELFDDFDFELVDTRFLKVFPKRAESLEDLFVQNHVTGHFVVENYNGHISSILSQASDIFSQGKKFDVVEEEQKWLVESMSKKEFIANPEYVETTLALFEQRLGQEVGNSGITIRKAVLDKIYACEDVYFVKNDEGQLVGVSIVDYPFLDSQGAKSSEFAERMGSAISNDYARKGIYADLTRAISKKSRVHLAWSQTKGVVEHFRSEGNINYFSKFAKEAEDYMKEVVGEEQLKLFYQEGDADLNIDAIQDGVCRGRYGGMFVADEQEAYADTLPGGSQVLDIQAGDAALCLLAMKKFPLEERRKIKHEMESTQIDMSNLGEFFELDDQGNIVYGYTYDGKHYPSLTPKGQEVIDLYARAFPVKIIGGEHVTNIMRRHFVTASQVFMREYNGKVIGASSVEDCSDFESFAEFEGKGDGLAYRGGSGVLEEYAGCGVYRGLSADIAENYKSGFTRSHSPGVVMGLLNNPDYDVYVGRDAIARAQKRGIRATDFESFFVGGDPDMKIKGLDEGVFVGVYENEITKPGDSIKRIRLRDGTLQNINTGRGDAWLVGFEWKGKKNT